MNREGQDGLRLSVLDATDQIEFLSLSDVSGSTVPAVTQANEQLENTGIDTSLIQMRKRR